MREIARATWNIPIINGYTSTEVAGIASECFAHDGLHLNDDMLILEIVDDDLRPVPSGKPGSKVLITSFLKNTIPIIRYEFSDILTAIDEPCACGCQFQRIKDVEGRREEMLYTLTPDGRRVEVHAPRFWFHLVRVHGIRNNQFAQLPEGIAIRIVPDPSHDFRVVRAAVERIARMALADLGAHNGHLEVHIVDEIGALVPQPSRSLSQPDLLPPVEGAHAAVSHGIQLREAAMVLRRRSTKCVSVFGSILIVNARAAAQAAGSARYHRSSTSRCRS